jgi:hypothetical protein
MTGMCNLDHIRSNGYYLSNIQFTDKCFFLSNTPPINHPTVKNDRLMWSESMSWVVGRSSKAENWKMVTWTYEKDSDES